MEQHPIPQNISSYQFRLVGDMTLKQFFQLAGGIVAGLIFYSSPLLGIIKWPFAIVSVVLGVAMAFLPFEERPLEKWILAFFRAIYSPTLYYWKRGDLTEKIFQDEPLEQTLGPKTDEEVDSSLGTKKIETPLSKLEDAEKGFLSGLTSMFSGLIQPAAATPAVNIAMPATTTLSATMSTFPASNTDVPASHPPEQQIQIPASQPVKIPQEVRPKVVVEEARPQVTTSQVAPILAGDEIISTRQALFSTDAAPPNPPVTPNVVVGQVVDTQKKIVEGAIMEIRDSAGRPIRALKSNKLGHFVIVTPLDSGKYDIVTEKDGFEFSSVTFEAIGEIIPPILVQGRRILNDANQAVA
jgi:hypothetical protein